MRVWIEWISRASARGKDTRTWLLSPQRPSSRIVTSVATPHIETGMTVLNSLLQPQGRCAAGDRLTIDRTGLEPLKAEHFPKGADGSHPRFWVVMAGPGDELLLPSVVEFTRQK